MMIYLLLLHQQKLAIFPIDEKTETIIFDPIEFAKMINDYFYEWYGEEFDLPYLL